MPHGRSRRVGIPPMRCGAKNSLGLPCRAWAIVGTGRCKDHGSWAPQVEDASQRRLTEAQLTQHEPDPDHPRPWAEVMVEAVHNIDVLQRSLRNVRLRVLRGEPVAADDLDRLLRLSQVAMHVTKVGVDARVDVELVRQAALQTETAAAAVVTVLARVLDGLGLSEEQRVLAHGLVHEELLALEDPAAQDGLRRGARQELEGRRR